MDHPALAMLETDLGLLNPAQTVTAYLNALLETAGEQITAKGVMLDLGSIGDLYLVCAYAAWLYRTRGSGGSMPRSLEYELQNRIVRTAVGTA